MARHPWVAEADNGVRWGIQLCAEESRRSQLDRDLKANPADALIESGKLVDQLGFDGLFIYDHPGQAPDPWVWLSGLAMVTENARLGSIVNCVYHRYPTYLARLASDLDHLSGGRFLLGLGAGYLKREFESLGAEFMSNKDRAAGLAEVVEIIRGVWGPEPFAFDGRYYQIERAQVLPPPVQEPWVPIVIGGGGEQVTLRNVARYADACNLAVESIEDVRRKLSVIDKHCEDLGRDPAEVLRTGFTLWLIMGEDESAIQRKVNHYFPEGIPDVLAPRVLTGTPEQIAEYYQQRVDIGFQYFVVQLIDGSDRETINLLAEQVVPNVK